MPPILHAFANPLVLAMLERVHQREDPLQVEDGVGTRHRVRERCPRLGGREAYCRRRDDKTKVVRPWLAFFAICNLLGMWLMRYIEVYPSTYGEAARAPFGVWEIAILMLYVGAWGFVYLRFMDAFPRVRATLLTSPYRDQVQVPYDPETLETLPAHE